MDKDNLVSVLLPLFALLTRHIVFIEMFDGREDAGQDGTTASLPGIVNI